MYVLWSKHPIGDSPTSSFAERRFALLAASTRKELRKKFQERFADQEHPHIRWPKTVGAKVKFRRSERGDRGEGVFEFSRVHQDDYSFYRAKVSCTDPDDIYSLEIDESGGGGSYHEYTYIHIGTLEEVLEHAENYFDNESEQTGDKHVAKMKRALVAKKFYAIPEGRTYECLMNLHKL